MPYSITDLTDEINTDPKVRGYAAAKTEGSASKLSDLLNATYAGVGTVWRTDVRAAELLGGLVWSEISAFTAAKTAQLQLMLSTETVDASNANIRAFFAGALTGAATSIANLTAISKVAAPTRAEERWGARTVVSIEDIVRAIRAGG